MVYPMRMPLYAPPAILDSISKVWASLKNLSFLVGLAVLSAEVDGVDAHDEDQKAVGSHTSIDTRAVMWCIL